MPAEGIGQRTDWLGGIFHSQFEPREGDIRQGCPAICQAGPLLHMAVFIPPAIFDEVQAVLHLPVLPDILKQLLGRDGCGV